MASSAESQRKVMVALQGSGRPLTRRMIEERTGLSHNTVMLALSDLGIKPEPVGTAHVFSVGNGAPRVRTSRQSNNGTATVDLIAVNAVKDYRLLHSMATALPAQLTPDVDPADATQALADYAVLLTSLTAQLQRVQNDPEWYSRLGGFDEELSI